MRIAPGERRERITLQQKQVTRNAIGEAIHTWADVATVWAAVRPLRGTQFYAANQMQHTVDVRFFIRVGPVVTPAMRLLWKTVPYDITGVIPGTGDYLGDLEIMATTGVRDG
jgi:SPP1 family predicted phage head-tail adaptor